MDQWSNASDAGKVLFMLERLLVQTPVETNLGVHSPSELGAKCDPSAILMSCMASAICEENIIHTDFGFYPRHDIFCYCMLV